LVATANGSMLRDTPSRETLLTGEFADDLVDE
jgi:hypothetical protein